MADKTTGLTSKYIDDHMAKIHTAESFGRALAEQALLGAKKKLGDRAADSVEVDAKITVSAVTALGCINVCATVAGVTVCYHVNV